MGRLNETTFQELITRQMLNQDIMLSKGTYEGHKLDETTQTPADDIKLASYHIQQLMSEIGEVLQADKRWKNMRNEGYDKEHKGEEIADCFIVLMNVAMFSGMTPIELVEAISNKIEVVSKRIAEHK